MRIEFCWGNLLINVHLERKRRMTWGDNNKMRFQVLTATSMKMTVVWDVAPCSLHQGDD
jgi:hypothetical protein